MTTMPCRAPRRFFRPSLIALACAAAAAPAWSQGVPAAPAPAASQPLEAQRVEITGSRIKQVDAEGASPVQVITREDILHTGATSVREVIDTLTAASTNGNTINDVNGSGTFSPGASQASLRNLGAQSTLLLLNGRRLALYPLPNFQETFSNLDTMPLEAVERIEVLKSGGSAVYGSDAIAGVINIITRRSYQGVEIDGSTQHSTKTGHFGEKSLALSGGIGNFDTDGYNAFGNIEYFHRDALFWSQILDAVNPKYAQASPSFGTPSTYSFPGNVDGNAVPGCTTLKGDLCVYDRYQRFQVVPNTDRLNMMLSGHVKVAGGNDWYSELLLSKIRTKYESAYAIYGPAQGSIQWLNPTTGLNNTFWEQSLPPTHPLNTTGDPDVDFRYRFADAPSYEDVDTTQFRVLTGLKGHAGPWDYDTAIGAMGGKTIDRQQGFYSYSGWIKEIGDPKQLDADGNLPPVDPDYFNKPGGYKIGGPNSQAVIDTLFPIFGNDAKTRQYFIDANAQTEIAQLPAGALGLSVGAELRHESMVLTPTSNLANSDIVGLAFSESDGSRNFGALYAELNAPLAKTFDMGIAGRLDKFPGFGAHFSPRANARWQPVEQVLFRGTIETGFRAPNLQESSQSTKTAFQPGVNDPKRCPAAQQVAQIYRDEAAASSDPDEAAFLLSLADTVQQNECGASVAIIALNNPDLQPERSLSKTLGAAFQITPHIGATIDWWSINRKNEINLKNVQDLLSAESSQAPGVIVRNPFDPTGATDPSFTAAQIDQYGITSGSLSSIKLQYGNLFETRTSGFDFGVRGDTPLPFGRLATTLDATYVSNYQIYSPTRNGTGAWGDNLAGRYGYPQWALNAVAALTTGDWTNMLRWVHRSGTVLQQDFDDETWNPAGCEAQELTPGQCKVGAYNRWDFSVSWSGYKGLTLGAYVTNIFQQRPPVDLRGFTESGGGIIPVDNEDAAGRLLKLFASYKF